MIADTGGRNFGPYGTKVEQAGDIYTEGGLPEGYLHQDSQLGYEAAAGGEGPQGAGRASIYHPSQHHVRLLNGFTVDETEENYGVLGSQGSLGSDGGSERHQRTSLNLQSNRVERWEFKQELHSREKRPGLIEVWIGFCYLLVVKEIYIYIM